jgi:hypothetical protein
MCCAVLLTACDRSERIVYVVPPVPGILREPVRTPARQIETANDLAGGYLEARAALATANGRIVAVDCILTAAETDGENDCGSSP